MVRPSILVEMAEYEKVFTSYVGELASRSNKEKVAELASLRDMPIEALEKAGVFYIGDMAEMMLPSYIDVLTSFGIISATNNRPIFHDRWVFPIRGSNGAIQNLVGYSMEANERYIYGTARYYRRTDTLYGLEELNTAYDMGYALLTEGITDTIRVRSLGYPNTFAMCGTHKSPFIVQQLNRCRHGVLRIPDRDPAGNRALQGWDFNRHLTINVPVMFKDVDELCKGNQENIDLLTTYLNDCIGWTCETEHNGQRCRCETVTML